MATGSTSAMLFSLSVCRFSSPSLANASSEELQTFTRLESVTAPFANFKRTVSRNVSTNVVHFTRHVFVGLRQ